MENFEKISLNREKRERERSRKLIEKQNNITIHYNSITEDVANTN